MHLTQRSVKATVTDVIESLKSLVCCGGAEAQSIHRDFIHQAVSGMSDREVEEVRSWMEHPERASIYKNFIAFA